MAKFRASPCRTSPPPGQPLVFVLPIAFADDLLSLLAVVVHVLCVLAVADVLHIGGFLKSLASAMRRRGASPKGG